MSTARPATPPLSQLTRARRGDGRAMSQLHCVAACLVLTMVCSIAAMRSAVPRPRADAVVAVGSAGSTARLTERNTVPLSGQVQIRTVPSTPPSPAPDNDSAPAPRHDLPGGSTQPPTQPATVATVHTTLIASSDSPGPPSQATDSSPSVDRAVSSTANFVVRVLAATVRRSASRAAAGVVSRNTGLSSPSRTAAELERAELLVRTLPLIQANDGVPDAFTQPLRSPCCHGGWTVPPEIASAVPPERRARATVAKAFASLAAELSSAGVAPVPLCTLPRVYVGDLTPEHWRSLLLGSSPVVVTPRRHSQFTPSSDECPCAAEREAGDSHSDGSAPMGAVERRVRRAWGGITRLLTPEGLSAGGVGDTVVGTHLGYNRQGDPEHKPNDAGLRPTLREYVKKFVQRPWSADGRPSGFVAYTVHNSTTKGTWLHGLLFDDIRVQDMRLHVPGDDNTITTSIDAAPNTSVPAERYQQNQQQRRKQFQLDPAADRGGRLHDLFVQPEGSGATPHAHADAWAYQAFGAKLWFVAEPSPGGVTRTAARGISALRRLRVALLAAARNGTRGADVLAAHGGWRRLLREAQAAAVLDRRVTAFRWFAEVAAELWGVQALLAHHAAAGDRTALAGAEAAAATGLLCVVRPGEAVYVPDAWWHVTLALDPSAAMTTFGPMGKSDHFADDAASSP